MRRAILRSGLDFASLAGVEIGPLCWPMVAKTDGEVIYVDYTDRATLAVKYEHDPNVDTSGIVEVDAIWGEQTLSEAIGGRKVDYVMASHVAEHVPDLISWLEEVGSVLNPQGQLRLVLPDKRFSFDYLRTETDISALLAAYVVKARRPQVREVVDFKAHAAPGIDPRRFFYGELGRADVKPFHTLEQVLGEGRAVVERPDHYIDVHCWVFTPKSFAGLMEGLAEGGLVRLACAGFTDSSLDSGCEFYVFLTPSDDRAQIVESWRKMAEAAADPLPGSAAAEALAAQARMAAELEHARARIAALESSTSWRLTAPLRSLARVLRG